MHIAIDTSPLESGHAGRGTGAYTRNLISALQKYESGHTYSFFTRTHNIPKSAQLIHYPYFDPFFLTLPLQKTKPTVVTVHDLIPLIYKEHFPAGVRGRLKWEVQRRSLLGATRVMTDSEASKKDIIRCAGVAATRIDVVYLAPNAVGPMKASAGVAVKKQFGLPKDFLLYVGDVNWNKNVQNLIRALALVPTVPLVVVGKAFLNSDLEETQRINATMKAVGVEDRIIRTGFVADAALHALYSLARVCIVPSYAEGFGLPVLEAMAAGTPVVAAIGSSLDEIAGPSIRINPNDAYYIAEGINQALRVNRATWKKQANEWLRRFSWEKVAHETIHSYEQALA